MKLNQNSKKICKKEKNPIKKANQNKIDVYGKFETDIPLKIVTHVLTDFSIIKGNTLNPSNVWYKVEWK